MLFLLHISSLFCQKKLIFPEGRSFFLEKPRILQVQHLSLLSLGGNIENIKGQFSVLIFISYNDISSRFKCTARLQRKTYRLSFLHLSEAFIELQLQGSRNHFLIEMFSKVSTMLKGIFQEHTSALAVEDSCLHINVAFMNISK